MNASLNSYNVGDFLAKWYLYTEYHIQIYNFWNSQIHSDMLKLSLTPMILWKGESGIFVYF